MKQVLDDGKKNVQTKEKVWKRRKMSIIALLCFAPRLDQTTSKKGVDYQDRRLPTAVWLYPGGPGEPYKSLLIKSGQFIDDLMSLGH